LDQHAKELVDKSTAVMIPEDSLRPEQFFISALGILTGQGNMDQIRYDLQILYNLGFNTISVQPYVGYVDGGNQSQLSEHVNNEIKKFGGSKRQQNELKVLGFIVILILMLIYFLIMIQTLVPLMIVFLYLIIKKIL
jgi:hypothetical protein